MYQQHTVHTQSQDDLRVSICPTVFEEQSGMPAFTNVQFIVAIGHEEFVLNVFHSGRWSVRGPTMGLAAADAIANSTPHGPIASPACPDCHGTGYAQVDEDEVAACGCPRMERAS